MAEQLGLSPLTLQHRLLSQEVYALGEIAYLLGFSDLSGFSRFFKRATGEAPGAHRHRLLRSSDHTDAKAADSLVTEGSTPR